MKLKDKLKTKEWKPECLLEYKVIRVPERIPQYKPKLRPKVVNKYDKRFNIFEIENFLRAKQPPQIINLYDKRFNAKEICSLIRFGCSAETANDYINKGFKIKHILQVFKSKREHNLGTINKFMNSFESDEASRFDRVDRYTLYEAGCSLQEIKKYDSRFSGLEIAILYRMDLKPDRISTDKQEQLFKLFRKNDKLSRKMAWLSKKEKNFEKFSFLGTGISGVVLLKEGNVYKFSEKIDKEYKLLKKIQDFHKGDSTNIIKLKDEPLGFIALELEYIQGDSLENILQRKSSKLNYNSRIILRKPLVLSKNKVLKYCSNIMNGLIEMRQAGIFYHRDIRPANIMIDEENDRAVIIDFGVATTDKKALPKDNRRYGGVNDLVSLGQVIYRMITGKHIFAKSKSMEKTTQAQKIKDYRDKVYSDKTGKLSKKHLKQVDETIEDEKLKALIKACLTAKNYEYKKIQRMIENFQI